MRPMHLNLCPVGHLFLADFWKVFKRGDKEEETKGKLSSGKELGDQEIAGKLPNCGGGRM